MSYSVLNAKQDLTGIIHGTTLNKVTNLNQLFNRSARQVLQDLDPQETIRIQQLNPVFTGVFDYPIPSDLKGTKIIDVFPQVNRTPNQITLSRYNQDFDLAKTSLMNMFTIVYNTGVKYLRLNSPYLNAPIGLNGADSITGNGTWAVGGDAGNLTVDNVNFVFGGGSLEFDLSGVATSGYLENSTMAAVDLSTLLNQGSNFLYTYLPTASAFTDLKYRFGSSPTDYYEKTITQTQQDTDFQDGWDLLRTPWLGSTVVGSPDPSSITYIRVTWDYDGNPQTGIHLNSIFASLGTILNLEYYSQDLFSDAITGAFQATVTDDSNLINLGLDSYNIFLNQLAYLVSQQIQGANAMQFDSEFFLKAYQEGVTKYKLMYKSQIQKPQTNYYVMPPKGYDGFLPRRWF